MRQLLPFLGLSLLAWAGESHGGSLGGVHTHQGRPVTHTANTLTETHTPHLLERGSLALRGGEGDGGAGGEWDRVVMMTGGCGFSGSVVVEHFCKKYPRYLVVVLDRLDECSTMNNVALVAEQPNFCFAEGDIKDTALVDRLIEEHKVDTVLHFAARTSVDESFAKPLAFSEDNVVGTTVLLECCRKAKALKLFLYCSTDEVYGDVPDGESREDHALEPTNPYSASKAAAEHMCMAYCKSFKMPVIITRTCNMYGRHQYPEKVIPRFALLAKRGLPCSVYGDGKAARSFIHVQDAAEAFDIVMHKGVIGEKYNIGTNDLVTVRELADKITLAVRGEHAEHAYVEDRVLNDSRYAVDYSKVRALGWAQRIPFDDGLQRTIEWYLEYGDMHWKAEHYDKALFERMGVRIA